MCKEIGIEKIIDGYDKFCNRKMRDKKKKCEKVL